MKYVIGTRTHATRTPDVSAALDGAHTVACVEQIDHGETAFVLGSESDVKAWARSAPAPILEQIERTEELARKARELEHADHARAEFWQALIVRHVQEQMASLAERTGLELTSPELLKLAHDGASVLEPPVLHSIVLWDGIACSGGYLPILSGVPFPTFSWLGFNDRASSANGVVGAATLWERSWYGGRAAFVGSIGAACVSLSNLNFNNLASSAIGV
jgi:hypothetical protein